MKDICVYTCITGNYDNLNEIKNPEKNIDYFCFTNNPNLTSKTWKVIQIQDNTLDNIRLARKIKILGHDRIKNYKIAVWTDADIIWQKSISDFVETYLRDAPFAIFKHHARNSIYDESIACLKMAKDSKISILKTLDFYQSENFPDNIGLCESTVFIKNQADPKVIQTMQLWFNMVKNFSYRDQLSFNYAVWKTNLKINYIPLNVWDNSWFYAVKHVLTNDFRNCLIYFGNLNSDFNFDFEKYFIYSYKKHDNSYQVSFSAPHNTPIIDILPTNNIGIKIQNIYFNTKIKDIEYQNAIPYKNSMVTYSGYSPFRIYGDFRKHQKITLSLELSHLSQSELLKLFEMQCFKNIELKNSITQLTSKIKNASSSEIELQKIVSSRSWKVIQKVQALKSFLLRR